MSDDTRKRVTDGSKVCGAFHPSEPYNCTGERGHPGDHFEHGPGSEILARWPAGETVESLRRELALAQEARLAAELRAEGLRDLLREAGSFLCSREGCRCAASRLRMERIPIALAAQPPDLAPLRELVAAVQRSQLEELRDPYNEALAAYPWLDPGADPPAEATE